MTATTAATAPRASGASTHARRPAQPGARSPWLRACVCTEPANRAVRRARARRTCARRSTSQRVIACARLLTRPEAHKLRTRTRNAHVRTRACNARGWRCLTLPPYFPRSVGGTCFGDDFNSQAAAEQLRAFQQDRSPAEVATAAAQAAAIAAHAAAAAAAAAATEQAKAQVLGAFTVGEVVTNAQKPRHVALKAACGAECWKTQRSVKVRCLFPCSMCTATLYAHGTPQTLCAGVCQKEVSLEATSWKVLEVSPDGLQVLRLEVVGHKKRCRMAQCSIRHARAAGAPGAPVATTPSAAPSNDDAPSSYDGEIAEAGGMVARKRSRYEAAPIRCGFDVAVPALLDVYVLHLVRRLDRNPNVEQIKLHFSPLRVTVVSALDGEALCLSAKSLGQYNAWPRQALTVEAISALGGFDDERARQDSMPFWTRELNAGELACSISHLQIWERAAAEPEVHAAVIFEDDARTTDVTRDRVVKILEHFRHSGRLFDIFRFARSDVDPRGWVAHREKDAEEWWDFPINSRRRGRVIADTGSWTPGLVHMLCRVER